MSDLSATKNRILDAAEALFAEQGIGRTSLRQITTTAEVNLAAVNYHFGSKDELLDAVYARRLKPMNEERLRRLESLEHAAGEAAVGVAELIEAFVAPALELVHDRSRGGAQFIQLLGRTFTEPQSSRQEAVRNLYQPVIKRFRAAFARALPDLPDHELYWRMHFLVGTLAYCMTGSDLMRLIASCRMCNPLDHDEMTRRLTEFFAAGMTAPARSEPVQLQRQVG